MKTLLFLGLLVVANAQYSEVRHIALDAVDKLREILPDYQSAHDVTINKLYESKQKALGELNSFYNQTLELKTNSLKLVMDAEQSLLNYGDTIEEWCFDNNIWGLMGITGWAGNKYSECIKKLDDSIDKDVAEMYEQFAEGEAKIQKYSIFEVFFKPSNIISRPESLADTISKLKIDITDDIPDFDDIIRSFIIDLSDKQSQYTNCLDELQTVFDGEIERLRKFSEECVEEQNN
ncbi:hypothetical protein RP20_CCG007187 [Aedes albopictus]|nr:hypothetical protein RP20_CCG007187 [Aedes albopictus]